MKRWLLALIATEALAGPGSSGGNPATINGLRHGYTLTSPYPDRVALGAATDTYDFSLRGYRLAVTKLPSAAPCLAAGLFKRVCVVRDEPRSKSAYVAFATGEAFEIGVTTLGTGPAELKVAFDRALLELTITTTTASLEEER